MTRPTRERSLVSLSALILCSTLAGSPVFAADFPAGSYAAKDLLLYFDKGQFHATLGQVTEVAGTYTIQKDRIEFTDVKGPWACTGAGQQKGTYSWTFDGSVLAFSKVSDSCDDRSRTLAASWRKQP